MILRFIDNERVTKCLLWLILASAFYYPLSACAVVLFNLPSTVTNVMIRGLFALASVVLIIIYFLKKYRLKLTIPSVFLCFFWMFYFSKIIFDIQSGVYFSTYSNLYVYTYIIGNILIPLTTLILWGRDIDCTHLADYAFYLFVLTSSTILITVVIVSGGLDFSIFLNRTQLQVGADDNVILNPIMIGFHGEALIIIALYKILLDNNVKYGLLFYPIVLLIGFTLILLGASRGPFVGVFLSIIVLLAYKYSQSKGKLVIIIKGLLIVVSLFYLLKILIGDVISIDDFYMFQRLTQFQEEGVGEEYRTIAIRWAWNDFLKNPIIGNHFVNSYDNFYPHNVFVELFMATGLVGFFLFLGFYHKVVIKYVLIVKTTKKDFFLLLIYTPIALLGFTSGSLFQSNDFWLFTVLVALKPFNLR
jgi:hypothetical protein